MKVGDLVKNRFPPFRNSFQVFEEVFGDWFGTVIHLEQPPRTSKYNRIHVLLSSHGGLVGKTWLTSNELEQNIEVVHETG